MQPTAPAVGFRRRHNASRGAAKERNSEKYRRIVRNAVLGEELDVSPRKIFSCFSCRRGRSFAAPRLGIGDFFEPHGWRRGLYSFAAPRLDPSDFFGHMPHALGERAAFERAGIQTGGEGDSERDRSAVAGVGFDLHRLRRVLDLLFFQRGHAVAEVVDFGVKFCQLVFQGLAGHVLKARLEALFLFGRELRQAVERVAEDVFEQLFEVVGHVTGRSN